LPDVERVNRIAVMISLGISKSEAWFPLEPDDVMAWDALQKEWDTRPSSVAWDLPNEMPD
jgi:hypothetical protein